MGFNQLFFGKTGLYGAPGAGVLMLNNRELFPDGPGFCAKPLAGMIIDRFSVPAGRLGSGTQKRERGGWT
jgi:hypothetical protein